MGIGRKKFDPENIRYLERFLGMRDMEVFQRSTEMKLEEDEDDVVEDISKLLTAMEMYQDNRWWLSKDYNTVAFYQLTCEFQLVSNSTYVEAVEFLLGRYVQLHEIREKKPELIMEAIKCWCAGGRTRGKTPHSTK